MKHPDACVACGSELNVEIYAHVEPGVRSTLRYKLVCQKCRTEVPLDDDLSCACHGKLSEPA